MGKEIRWKRGGRRQKNIFLLIFVLERSAGETCFLANTKLVPVLSSFLLIDKKLIAS